MAKIRTLVVDSSFLLKSSYHGAKNSYTISFGHIGGLYGFITKVRQLIKTYQINKVILVWDGEDGGIYRHIIDPAYKANRKSKKWHQRIELTDAEIKREQEKEESLLKQRKRIQAYAEELFLRQIEVEKVEADDLIAAYCTKYHKIEDILIFTNDRDFVQLLDLEIKILFNDFDEPITKVNAFTYFPYHYKNALTWKILLGDTSDNIKGVQGLGEKTLIQYFPEMQFKPLTVREICQKARQLNEERVTNKKKPLKVFTTMLDSLEIYKRNFKLINLKEPFLNEEAEDELDQLLMPLSDEDRGAKNLYKMMIEDGFLEVYGSDFVNYVEPFYPVIMNEKNLLKQYYNS